MKKKKKIKKPYCCVADLVLTISTDKKWSMKILSLLWKKRHLVKKRR